MFDIEMRCIEWENGQKTVLIRDEEIVYEFGPFNANEITQFAEQTIKAVGKYVAL